MTTSFEVRVAPNRFIAQSAGKKATTRAIFANMLRIYIFLGPLCTVASTAVRPALLGIIWTFIFLKCTEDWISKASFFQVGQSHFMITLFQVKMEWVFNVLSAGSRAFRRIILTSTLKVCIFLELLCIIANTAVKYAPPETFSICTWEKCIVAKKNVNWELLRT